MAFKDGQFVEVTEKGRRKANGAFSSSIQLTLPFVCPTELGDLADHYEEFQKWV